MLKNYFVLFVRNLARQKLFSIINLLGLTAGIACTLVIYLYVRNDFSHDRFHKNADRIYRVNQTNIQGDNEQQLARTGPGVALALSAELPEVEMVTSIHTAGNFLVSYVSPSSDVTAYDQENVLAGDENFFKMFSFDLVKGNPETCLRNPQSIVLTEAIAQLYFGDADPIGKALQIGQGDNARTFEVTGIVKDIGSDSYIDFDMLMSLSSFPRAKGESWIWTQLETFVLLNANADIESTRRKLVLIPRKYAASSGINMSFDDFLKTGKSWNLYLQPLTKIHLHSSDVIGNFNVVGNIKIVYALVAVAVFIVILSCINFINLSTAQFTRRTRDAGIRKILGLGRRELGLGYFFEGFAFCAIAMIAAFAVVQVMLPWLSSITGKILAVDFFHDGGLVIVTISLLLLMSILSGSFPALFLTAFQPMDAIKGKLRTGQEGRQVRNGLVVVQFTVSIVLIICTTIVFQQLSFLSEKDLGFNKENLLVIDHVERIENGATFSHAISGVPGVINTSLCTSVPMRMGSDVFKPRNYGDKDFKLHFAGVDDNYLSALGADLIIGRDFSAERQADVDGVILNETAAKQLGWTVDKSIIGKIIDYPNEDTRFQVMGVVRDYHFTSLESQIEPMALFHIDGKAYNRNKYVLVRVAPQSGEGWQSTLLAIKKVWKQQAGDMPFQYNFVDETFATRLQTQQQFGNALQMMSALTLLIAGLGLLGMVIYSLEQRTKEIGIRKISGASVWNILVLLSHGYVKLIVVSFAVAAPLSYWLVQQWLQDFGNRITPSIWIFALTGIGTLILAFLITSYHSVKAALTNPIEVLKDE
jgi:putative ABC transport system permease protein